jgi:hypothetical protein
MPSCKTTQSWWFQPLPKNWLVKWDDHQSKSSKSSSSGYTVSPQMDPNGNSSKENDNQPMELNFPTISRQSQLFRWERGSFCEGLPPNHSRSVSKSSESQGLSEIHWVSGLPPTSRSIGSSIGCWSPVRMPRLVRMQRLHVVHGRHHGSLHGLFLRHPLLSDFLRQNKLDSSI